MAYANGVELSLVASQRASVPRFQLLTAEEVMVLPSPEWLIEGIVPQSGLAVIAGKPGIYKTFLALDLALSVASGCDWNERSVNQGDVVYVLGEGVGGLKARIAAWLQVHQCELPSNCRFITEGIQLLDNDAVSESLDSMECFRVVEPRLIVFDTLARCFVGGDENEAKDMGILVHNAGRISAKTGATVLLVHHTGYYDGEYVRPRGSSALPGAVDTEIGVRSPQNMKDRIKVMCNKQKDSEPFADIELFPRSVPLASGLTSLVLDGQASVLTERQRRIIECLTKQGDLRLEELAKRLPANLKTGKPFDSSTVRGELVKLNPAYVTRRGKGTRNDPFIYSATGKHS